MTQDVTALVELAKNWIIHNGLEPDGASSELSELTNLLQTGWLDSLGFVRLLAFLEEETGYRIDLLDAEPESFSTIGGLCDLMMAGSNG